MIIDIRSACIQVEPGRVGNVATVALDGDSNVARDDGGRAALAFGGGRGHGQREVALGESVRRFQRQAGKLIGNRRDRAVAVVDVLERPGAEIIRVFGSGQQGRARRRAGDGDRERLRAVLLIGEIDVDVERDGGRPGIGLGCAIGIRVEIEARLIGDALDVDIDEAETGVDLPMIGNWSTATESTRPSQPQRNPSLRSMMPWQIAWMRLRLSRKWSSVR